MQQQPRAPFRLRGVLALLLAAVPALALAQTRQAETGQAETRQNDVPIRIDERQIRAAGIELARPQPEAGTAQTVLPGTVAVPPQQLRVVAAPAAGLLEAVLVAPNQVVQAGQPIARLRSTDLLEAQRTYLQALSAEELARTRLDRDEQMYRERIIALRRLQTTRADHAFALTTLQEREQMLALLGMPEADIREVRGSHRMVATLTIPSPEAGVVLEIRATAGERVLASAPLFSIANLKPLWINLQVPLPQAVSLAPGTRASVPGTAAQGEVIILGRSADPQTQSVVAVVQVEDGAEDLRPGQVVSATVALRPDGTPQWRLPAGSAVRHAGRSWVFVRTTEGFRALPVTVMAESPNFTSIRAGLAPDDQIAVRGILALLAELTEVYGG